MATQVTKLFQYSDGTSRTEVGGPQYVQSVKPQQNQLDNVKYVNVALIPDGTLKTEVEYRTNGLPLADTGSGEITVTAATPEHEYKFSAFLAHHIKLGATDYENLVICDVKLATLHIADPGGTDDPITSCMYDVVNDKVRLFLASGVEVATGTTIQTEDADKQLLLRVAYI